jgi:hypothetical protein
MGGRTSEEKRKLYKLAAHIAGARPPERRQRKSPACAGLWLSGVEGDQHRDCEEQDGDGGDDGDIKCVHHSGFWIRTVIAIDMMTTAATRIEPNSSIDVLRSGAGLAPGLAATW